MVRQEGFEPPTTWFEARYSIQLSYWRKEYNESFYGAPGRSRTSDRLVRSQVLYPAELLAPIKVIMQLDCDQGSGAPGRIRTSDRLVRSQVLYPAELLAHIMLH